VVQAVRQGYGRFYHSSNLKQIKQLLKIYLVSQEEFLTILAKKYVNIHRTRPALPFGRVR
jgi:hypothetical protein